MIIPINHIVLYLLYHGISDLLKDAREYLMMIFALELLRNSFAELLIHLLSNPPSPADHLIIYQLHPLIQVLSLLALLFQSIDLVVQLSQFWGHGTGLLSRVSVVRLLHLELVQLLPPVLVLSPKVIDLSLVV